MNETFLRMNRYSEKKSSAIHEDDPNKDTRCRLCLKEDGERKSVFSSRSGTQHTNADLIEIICPIFRLSHDDKLPKTICYQCLETVYAACDLRVKSFESQGILMQEQMKVEVLTNEIADPMNRHLSDEDEVNQQTEGENQNLADKKHRKFLDDYFYLPPKLKKNRTKVCKWCSESFDRYIDWRHHMSSAHLDRKIIKTQTIECSFCPTQFGSIRGMKFHLQRIHNLDPGLLSFNCAHCHFQTSDKFRLEIHIKEEHFGVHGKPFHCLICKNRFMSQTNLRKHLLRRHKILDSNTFFCDLCDFSCLLKSKLGIHMDRVHLISVDDFLCDSCDIICKSGHEKKLHHYIHSSSVKTINQELEMLSCVICPLQFRMKNELLDHLRVHQKILKNQTTACILCSKVINGYNHAIEHTRFKHVEKFTHRCLECNRNFIYSLKFLIHLRNHIEKKPLDHLCTECGRSFTTVADMNRHIRVEHKKIYQCPYCPDVVYKSIPSFRQHVDGHTNSHKFKCSLCPKTFSVKNKFESHFAFHLNDKMNQCPTCGKGFEKPYSLKVHMQRHDGTLVKNHQCGFCDKKFRSKWARDGHERTHTNEKPFKCEHCPSAYKQKGDYMKHLKIHVGENVYSCSDCSERFRLLQDLNAHKMNIHHV